MLILTVAISASMTAQTLDMHWNVVDAGGGISQTNGFTLHASIGQTAASSNDMDGIRLANGFLPGGGVLAGIITRIERFERVADFSLQQNYPNPFNPTTTITYTLERTSDVTLEIFTTAGQRVHVLEGTQLPGEYHVTFDAANLESGTYFYRLTAGDFSQVRSMTLIK